MKKVRLSELSETVRTFLNEVKQGESIVVEDDNGQLQFGITPYAKASPEEKRQAMIALEKLWEHTGAAMQEAGVSEEDIDRDLQEDD